MQRIIHLQAISNKLPYAFIDAAKTIKSHILTINTSRQIHVPKEQKEMDNNVSRLKHGKPIGSNDVVPRKMRGEYGIYSFNFGTNYP